MIDAVFTARCSTRGQPRQGWLFGHQLWGGEELQPETKYWIRVSRVDYRLVISANGRPSLLGRSSFAMATMIKRASKLRALICSRHTLWPLLHPDQVKIPILFAVQNPVCAQARLAGRLSVRTSIPLQSMQENQSLLSLSPLHAAPGSVMHNTQYIPRGPQSHVRAGAEAVCA